jgi:hypothetical protein
LAVTAPSRKVAMAPSREVMVLPAGVQSVATQNIGV